MTLGAVNADGTVISNSASCLVLRIDIETANRWTERKVLEQWHKLLTRLNIPQDNWLKLTTEFGKM